MMRWVAVAAVGVALGASGCAKKEEAAAPPAEPVARAAAPKDEAVEAAKRKADRAAKRLGEALFAALSKALAEGAPEGAITVCGDVAPRIAAEVAAAEGVAVSRTALRVRNPKNAPDAWEREVLESWLAEGAGAAPFDEVVEGEGGARTLRAMRPIVLQPLCATCHGTDAEIPDAVKQAIALRYPGDRATGFAAGDLRGAFTVRVPAD